MRKNDLIYASKDAVIQRYTVSVITILCFARGTFAKKGTFAVRGRGFIYS